MGSLPRDKRHRTEERCEQISGSAQGSGDGLHLDHGPRAARLSAHRRMRGEEIAIDSGAPARGDARHHARRGRDEDTASISPAGRGEPRRAPVHEVGEGVRGGAMITAKRGEATDKAQGRGELMAQGKTERGDHRRGRGGGGAKGADQLNEAHGAGGQVERGGEGGGDVDAEAVTHSAHLKGGGEMDTGAALKGGEGVEDHSGARIHKTSRAWVGV